MDSSVLPLQGRRLLQIGMALLLYSALEGFVIPVLASPRIALSLHTLSGFEGVVLLTQGLLWNRLKLGIHTSRIAFWCALYSGFATLAVYTLAAFWGVGNETIRFMGELPHGLSHGTPFQEMFIKVLAYSAAPPALTWLALVLWGLRKNEG